MKCHDEIAAICAVVLEFTNRIKFSIKISNCYLVPDYTVAEKGVVNQKCYGESVRLQGNGSEGISF